MLVVGLGLVIDLLATGVFLSPRHRLRETTCSTYNDWIEIIRP